LEFRKDKDHKVKEDVGADVKENYVRYHVKDDDSEVWVINDFNRASITYPCTCTFFIQYDQL